MSAGSSRSQSAIEFISTYSFVFLIIAIVIVVLFALSSVPKKAVPGQCTAYGGFNCQDIVLTNTLSGARLMVVLIDSQPGAVAVGGFKTTVSGVANAIGSCTPSNTLTGNTLTCTASLTGPFALGSVYTGTFNITANYCANAPSNVLNRTCASGTGYTYGGSFLVQGQLSTTTVP